MLRICAFVVTVVALIIGPAASYSYVEWDVEPVIDYNKDPGIARSVFFIHMRKAAGTAVRQFFREAYQRLQWSEIIRLRKQALESGQLTDTFKVDAKLNIFYPERNMRLITCLRHPIDRLISITWYGESSHGMKYMKYLHSTGQIGEDKDGNDISSQPDGQHKRTWYRNSVDLAKRYAAQNATLWNRWVSHVDQSTIWNYYVTRLAGGECAYKDNACRLAARCFAMGHERGGDGVEDGRAMDKEHPAGCRALFTNDHSFEKPLFNQKRSSDPDRFGVEEPAPPGPWPMARWVDKALSQACDKHSHKTVHFVNRTRHDLEDAKATLAMFDVVLISERLGEPGTKRLMEANFGPAVASLDFPNANRGLFSHDMETQMRAGWRKSVPAESLKLILQLNSLDVRLYWFADKLLDKRIKELDESGG